ncbi:Phenylalanine ammonia-lyase 2 [Pleurotus pulmonarius]
MTILSGTTAAPRVNGTTMNGHSKPHTNGVHLNGHPPKPITGSPWPQSEEKTLLDKFVEAYHEFESYKSGQTVKVDGKTLSLAGVVAAARHHAKIALDDSVSIKDKVVKSRKVIADKVASGASVYGLSTGFGGSADTRTDQPLSLGHALLQHQHVGVLPSSSQPLDVLPLSDPMSGTSMPEAWVRAAMLIRMNSLIRGHSGVRWELIEKIAEIFDANITPVVPLRSSISASGDLSPLSYIAGTVVGNPSIRVFDGPAAFGAREMLPSAKALANHGIDPLPLASKEPLGILNGTAFSAAVGALALNEAVHFAMLAQVCTAMGTEALVGTRLSFEPFIHATCRPHPGQIEAARNIYNLLEGTTFASVHHEEVHIAEDQGTLRQDRYPLRTSPQFLGPQLEDILHAYVSVTQECNSTTDNPLIDGETGEIHHGGNFQAMAVTNAMEKTRLALHHIGKLLFAQCTELVNPAMNNGLPPSLAATDPSLNYHTKGIDIATAAYVSELGYLANPVSTHIQSAEMHNQAVNSLALISARATVNSLDVLSLLISSYLYILCQALDLRALQTEFVKGVEEIIREELSLLFASVVSPAELAALSSQVLSAAQTSLDTSGSMDAPARMKKMASTTTIPLFDFLTELTLPDAISSGIAMVSIPSFRSHLASRATALLDQLRRDYLSGQRGPAPASPYLNKTRMVYEFVRLTLGVKMHGSENYARFAKGLGVEDETIGQNISRIHEAIRDGKMQAITVAMFA